MDVSQQFKQHNLKAKMSIPYMSANYSSVELKLANSASLLLNKKPPEPRLLKDLKKVDNLA